MKVFKVGDPNIPADAVYIGRNTRYGNNKWGNPFEINANQTRDDVIAKHREWLLARPGMMQHLPELKGKDLVCHCAPLACHGDTLMELANKEVEVERFVIAVTGHRLKGLSPAQRDHAKAAMTELLTKAKAKYGDKLYVLIGMSDGIDQIGAQVCVDLGIKWTACVPHENYFFNYRNGNDELLSKATKVVYVCNGNWHFSMNFKRNEYMLQYADAVLACAKFDIDNIPSRGGTAHMCRIAQQAGKHIVHVKL